MLPLPFNVTMKKFLNEKKDKMAAKKMKKKNIMFEHNFVSFCTKPPHILCKLQLIIYASDNVFKNHLKP